MRSRLPCRSVLMPLSLLAMTFCLAACNLPTATLTDATNGSVAAVCRAWPVVTYSSKDTAQTQKEARASNAARTAWGCSP